MPAGLVPGRVVCTRGISALPPETQIRIWAEVSRFDNFTEGDDPYGERDFGAFRMPGVPEKIFVRLTFIATLNCSGELRLAD